ncbi:MAG: hypothetical protein E7463_01670 [Ruminococcaceae bacterium]|nr:hypothetical protein [Oscillospiraceae bacterium]
MSERVTRLAALSREQDLIAPSIPVEYDGLDLALPEPMFNAKRIAEYIVAQPVYLTEENRFTGMLRLGAAEVPADVFTRTNHKHIRAAQAIYYRKYVEQLVTFEWQHSAPNYRFILDHGIEGRLAAIRDARVRFADDTDKLTMLDAFETVCRGIIAWSEKCADAHEAAAAACTDDVRKQELLRLAAACRQVPAKPARSFYEGLQSIIMCFQFLPDSVGTIDRALWDLYRRDIESGAITRDEARDLIAEIFVHLSNFTPVGNGNADRSAECHFAIGGYTPDGEDGFTDLSRLMVEALMSIDTRRPAISLRWTNKTPFEVLHFMLDCERHDKNKRFAFVSDEPRIKALMNISGFSYEDAVKYTMVGCNEPSFPGALWIGGCTSNAVRSLVNTLYNRSDEVIACRDFDAFYAIFREELARDIERILFYAGKFNAMRAKDASVLSAFLLDGCIENATPPNRFGCEKKIGGFNLMGITCVIDSLSMVKQFVFDEQRTSMAHLIDVLRSNWESDPDLRTEILKTGRFFGNNDPLSDGMARRYTTDLYELTRDRRLTGDARILIGTLAGYNPHHMKYGAMMPATPDGRFDGDGLMVGTGQAGGKDRKGMLALMKSLAQMDPNGILCGPNVCNMLIDEVLIRDDRYFESVCRMIEQYFRMGGIHVQLNYVSREELEAARKTPENYRSLKVRVSGYSASFVGLPDEHQREIINRTVQKG